MLETYFVRPQTVDRVRALWIGPEIERYVAACSRPRHCPPAHLFSMARPISRSTSSSRPR